MSWSVCCFCSNASSVLMTALEMAARERPIRFVDARQTSRSAIRPKPIGSARSAIHFGAPGAISPPVR